MFLTGFIQRIEKNLKNKNIEYELKIDENYQKLIDAEKIVDPEIENITFRDYQNVLIKNALKEKRGVIKSATGSGKTIVELGLFAAFPDSKILLLCHTKDIIDQTFTELKKYNFQNIYKVKNGKDKEWLNHKIVVSTIQSFIKNDISDYAFYFDVVIVDECHFVSTLEKNKKEEYSLYGEFFRNCYAPFKFGFTATLPRTEEGKAALEGLIGPIISEYNINKGVDEKYLSKINLKFLSVPKEVHNKKTYKDIEEAFLIKNKTRNNLIVSQVKKKLKQSKSTLIFVKKKDHGFELEKMFEKEKIKHKFVYGDIDNREEVKQQFENKELKVVISTSVWREGVNIKSLNCVILASVGKSDTGLIQYIGRGTRITEDKDEVEIIDFLDPYRYLSEHCVHRISIYNKMGWI